MKVDLDQIKIWSVNLTALVIELTDLFGAVIGFVGATAATGYTLHKWYILIKEQRKNGRMG